MVVQRPGTFLDGHDFRFDRQVAELRDEIGVLVDLVSQTRCLAALEDFHADDLLVVRQVAVQQRDRVLEAGPGAGHGVADEIALLVIAAIDDGLILLRFRHGQYPAVPVDERLHAAYAREYFEHRLSQFSCLVGRDGRQRRFVNADDGDARYQPGDREGHDEAQRTRLGCLFAGVRAHGFFSTPCPNTRGCV
jgi:hypothetical protein